MKSAIIVLSQELDKADVRNLLQAIRDCEQNHFPTKKISILANVPELSEEETLDILTSISPPFSEGPFIFRKQ